MNAVQALSLRKPNRNVANSGDSRFQNKKSNIKEILMRNFFRKYPIGDQVTDAQQMLIEREVAGEFENFVAATREISTRNLTEFESSLAR